jgi:hypothetical protein
MAFPWLDAARYADSNGYQTDGERFMWRWRDWVINAFNRNMPYDQFTIEQLAGDLLPHATLDQKIATGFNRNHRGNSEGGIIPEEYAAEYVVDRVDTYSFDGDLAPQVAVLQDAKGSRSPLYVRPGTANAQGPTLEDRKQSAPATPTFAPGQIGQAATFDGRSFLQFDGDIAGFDSYGSGRGALGENDPTVTYDVCIHRAS